MSPTSSDQQEKQNKADQRFQSQLKHLLKHKNQKQRETDSPMSTRVLNIAKNKKFNSEDEDLSPYVEEDVTIKFDYPFKTKKSKEKKKDQGKELIGETEVITPGPVLEVVTSLSESTMVEN